MVKKVLNVNGTTTDWLKIKHGKSACLFIKKLSVDVLGHGCQYIGVVTIITNYCDI